MHPTHTGVPGECRTAEVRRRAGKPRAGRHPREPQVPSLDNPAADLQQQLPGNLGDLGAEEERQATKDLPERADETQEEGGDEDGPKQRRRKRFTETGSGPEHHPN